MTSAEYDFEGSTCKSLDDKDRLVLPPDWRRFLTGEIVLSPGATRCIEIRSLHEWARFKAMLKSAAQQGSRQRKELLRHIVGHAFHASVDGQGRVRVSPELLEWVGVATEPSNGSRELELMGAGTVIELWRPETYRARRDAGEPSFEDTLEEIEAEHKSQAEPKPIQSEGHDEQ